MLQPYRPGRIPIVFIHGLRSSPLAWLKDINEVWGDPELRERYQVWIYMYPTGKPLPLNGRHAARGPRRAAADDRPGPWRPDARPDGAGRPQHGGADREDDAAGERRRHLAAVQQPSARPAPRRARPARGAAASLLLPPRALGGPRGLHRDAASRQRDGRPVDRPGHRSADPDAEGDPVALPDIARGQRPRCLHAPDARAEAE